jgi:glycosyltransferase involved in cell wall biosynthesis
LPPADRSSARVRLQLASGQICAGFVGRISGQKAVDRLIRAFGSLYATHPLLVVAVVGDGEELPAMRALASQLQVADRIRFLGAADGVALMAGFDLFVLSSNYEAFPYVYLEALARGLPIVTTDVGGATAVVEPGVNGYIVPRADLSGFAQAIGRLTDDAGLRQRMSQAALQKSQSKTLAAMVDNTLAVYLSLLPQTKP